MKKILQIAGLALLLVPGVAQAKECQALDTVLSFCGAEGTWTPRQSKNPAVVGAYRGGASLRLNFLRGNVGGEEGLTIDRLVDFQRESYAQAGKVPVADIPVLEREPVEADGMTGERAVYATSFDGRPFVIAISFFVLDDKNLQVLTVDKGKSFGDSHRTVHDRVLTEVRFKKDGS